MRAGLHFTVLTDSYLAATDDSTELCGVRLLGLHPINIINIYQQVTEWRTGWKRRDEHRSTAEGPPFCSSAGPEDSQSARASRPAAGAWPSGPSGHSAKTLTVIISPWWSRSGQRRHNRNASRRPDGPSRRRTGRSSRRTVRRPWSIPWRGPVSVQRMADRFEEVLRSGAERNIP